MAQKSKSYARYRLITRVVTALEKTSAGRCVHPLATDALDIVTVNGVTDAKTVAHLLKYDPVLGHLQAGRSGQRRCARGA